MCAVGYQRCGYTTNHTCKLFVYCNRVRSDLEGTTNLTPSLLYTARLQNKIKHSYANVLVSKSMRNSVNLERKIAIESSFCTNSLVLS